MAIPPRHCRVSERAGDKIDVALLSTRIDLNNRLGLVDVFGKSYNSLVPIECLGFV